MRTSGPVRANSASLPAALCSLSPMRERRKACNSSLVCPSLWGNFRHRGFQVEPRSRSRCQGEARKVVISMVSLTKPINLFSIFVPIGNPSDRNLLILQPLLVLFRWVPNTKLTALTADQLHFARAAASMRSKERVCVSNAPKTVVPENVGAMSKAMRWRAKPFSEPALKPCMSNRLSSEKNASRMLQLEQEARCSLPDRVDISPVSRYQSRLAEHACSSTRYQAWGKALYAWDSVPNVETRRSTSH